MSPLYLIVIVCGAIVSCDESGSPREEKLRSALIDAFQNIKKASAKGGVDAEAPLAADLIGSLAGAGGAAGAAGAAGAGLGGLGLAPRARLDQLEEDADGLTFAEAFGADAAAPAPAAEPEHNVQHIKSFKLEKTTPKPKDVQKFAESVRVSTNVSQPEPAPADPAPADPSPADPSPADPAAADAALGIDRLLRVWDAALLVQQWGALRRRVRGECRDQLALYVAGLRGRELWAMKMDDASGRYTNNFYWGNNYWTGSAELCAAINQPAPALAPPANHSSSQIFSAWRGDVSATGAAPFRTAFYTARLELRPPAPRDPGMNQQRTVHLGVCWPAACGARGVRALLAAARAPLAFVVSGVRAPTAREYDPTRDRTFQMLCAAAAAVSLLLAAGTAYDVRLARAVRRRRRRASNLASVASVERGAPPPEGKAKSMYADNNNLSEERLAAAAADDELQLSVWQQLLLSFSMKANILQIFDQTVGADTVPVVHGLRMLSMVWVIFGHTCIILFKYADNPALRAVLERSLWFQLVLSAVYSVDTFFCLGGMLVAFLYFRTAESGKLARLTRGRRKLTAALLQFLGLIGYRFARLTAPYMFMLGVVEVSMKWFAANAVLDPPARDHLTCPEFWWRNLLYINTLFPIDQMCMLWSWYLSDDTQFYAVSAVLLILATSHFKVSAALTGLLFVSSLLTTAGVSYSGRLAAGDDPFSAFDKIYDKPWTRLGPYLVGMAVGWLLYKTNLRIKMNRWCALLGWSLSGGALLALVFGLHARALGGAGAALYAAASHSLWAAAVGWVIVACSTGYGGWLGSALASPLLYPFSRVTYCAYLVHPVVLRLLAMRLAQPVHLDELFVFVMFLGLTVISYFLAFVISVAFEAPVVTMLKIVSPQKRPHRV